MGERGTLNPTLWRTCRAIANLQRLKICAHLRKYPGQTVSEVAGALRMPLAVASQYLRALNARSLLEARRLAGYVHYRVNPDLDAPAVGPLLKAFGRVDWDNDAARKVVFRMVTVFTHPRRIAIYRVLSRGPQSPGRLRRLTHISSRALQRHLLKMRDRGFVAGERFRWYAIQPAHPVADALVQLATSKE